MTKSTLLDLEVSVVIDSTKHEAVLVNYEGRQAWLPRSQIELEYLGRQNAQTAKVTLPEWLAIAKRLV